MRPRALFLGLGYAGHRTRYENLVAHTAADARIFARYELVTGWTSDGTIERLPLLGPKAKGWLRATTQARAFAAIPRPDVIWSAATEVTLPHLWSQIGPLKRPLIVDSDATNDQLEAMASEYFDRLPRRGLRRSLSETGEGLLWGRATFITPWSRWAADGLERRGVPRDRLRILPPGVDLVRWQQTERQARATTKIQLLFVGGDWRRKGGDLIVDVFRAGFADRCDLHVVTRGDVPAAPGITVHHLEANSPALVALYRNADLFVLPTRADCFGIATVEAMASGLPVIMTDVGGARDIVDDGDTGWLIQPTHEDLRASLEQALARPDLLAVMGRRARAVAEQRFDGQRNDTRVVDLMLEAIERHAERSPTSTVPQPRRAAVLTARPKTLDMVEQPSRVMFVLQTTAIGGMESHCVDLAAEYVRRGIDVMAVVPRDSAFDTLGERFGSAGCAVERADTDSRSGRWQQARQLLRFTRRARRFAPNVVHLQTGGATGGTAVVLLARALGAAAIVTEHDVPSEIVPARVRLSRLVLDRLTHVLIAVSRRNARLRSERIAPMADKFAVVLNGVPLPDLDAATRLANRHAVRQEYGIGAERVLLGSVVRLADGKGIPVLLDALARLRDDGHDCDLMLVGDGPLRGELERQCASLGISGAVRFAGNQRQPGKFVDAFDAFVLPVPAGSMSIALLEAMARGVTPAITFCGPEEAIRPDQTGICAPPNDPIGLAQALAPIVADAALRDRLGAAAAEHVRKHYSVARVADDALDLYRVASGAKIPSRLRADAPADARPGDRGASPVAVVST
jgi:glycosyltransferase involved in cell wall biosynthesis